MQSIPEAAEVTVRAIPISLWSSDYHPATDDEPGKPVFSPVRGAYVACIRVASGWRGAISEKWRLRCGRTNDYGWVLLRERGALGGQGEMPRSNWRAAELPAGGVAEEPDPSGDLDLEDAGVPHVTSLEMFDSDAPVMVALDAADANAEALYVMPNETYRIHWSHDRALSDLFLQRYEDDPDQAFSEFQVREYVVQPFGEEARAPYLRELPPVERGWVTRQLSTEREGYHAGWPTRDVMCSAVFDGTPQTLRSLFLCEWLCDACTSMVQQDQDWAYLNSLCGVIEASLAGAAIPDLAAALPSDERAQSAYQMRAYLHALASCGMTDRALAQSLVDVARTGTLGDWREIAERLQRNPRFSSYRHPANVPPAERLLHEPQYFFNADEQRALVAYFDMYVLGFEFADDLAHIKEQWKDVRERASWILANSAERLAAVSHMALMRALAVHVPHDTSHRRGLLERYHRCCAQLGVRFWKHPELAVGAQSTWDAYKPFLAWLAEDMGMLVETLQLYARSYRVLTALEVEAVAQYLFRHDLVLAGKSLDKKMPERAAQLSLVPSADGDEVLAIVTERHGSKEVARLKLLSNLAPDERDRVHGTVGKNASRATVRRLRAVGKKTVRTFSASEQTVTYPDADSLEGFGKKLAVFASGIKLAIAVKAAIDKWNSDPASDALEAGLFLNLVQESFAAVGPTTELIALHGAGQSLLAANDSLVRGGQRLVRLGLGLEAVRGVLAGLTTLATLLPHATRESLGADQTTDLDRYLRDHNSVAAWVETTKGMMQVGVGVAQLCTLGGATTLAGLALSQVVAVGLVAVAMSEVIIYVDTGGPSPVQEFKDQVRRARQQQLSLQAAARPIPGKGTSCKLARRLGSLNELAQIVKGAYASQRTG